MADSGYVDLRSDTVTRPTAAMRRAMADAEVGDDLFGDDPTVLQLQERAAGLTGKQAALYLSTGTLCNQIAMHVLAGPGHVVVCEQSAHVSTHELISSAMLSSITFRAIAGHPLQPVVDALGDESCLLLLDNYETVADPDIKSFLGRPPAKLHVLITSSGRLVPEADYRIVLDDLGRRLISGRLIHAPSHNFKSRCGCHQYLPLH